MIKHTLVYHVSTEGDCEGRSMTSLGYATGEVVDIRNYFLHLKTYELKIEPITVLHITKNSLKEKFELMQMKRHLQSEIEKIDKQLEVCK